MAIAPNKTTECIFWQWIYGHTYLYPNIYEMELHRKRDERHSEKKGSSLNFLKWWTTYMLSFKDYKVVGFFQLLNKIWLQSKVSLYKK